MKTLLLIGLLFSCLFAYGQDTLVVNKRGWVSIDSLKLPYYKVVITGTSLGKYQEEYNMLMAKYYAEKAREMREYIDKREANR